MHFFILLAPLAVNVRFGFMKIVRLFVPGVEDLDLISEGLSQNLLVTCKWRVDK